MTEYDDAHDSELADRLELYGEVSLAPKLGARWQRHVTRRVDTTLKHAQAFSGLSVDNFADVVHSDERIADALWQVVNRASQVGDWRYRQALARLLAAGTDRAKVDIVAILIEILVRLQPVQLRMFLDTLSWEHEEFGSVNVADPVEANQARWGAQSQLHLMAQVGLKGAVFDAMLAGLERADLLEKRKVRSAVESPRPTELGWLALELLFPLVRFEKNEE